ncbi:phage integrase family protein [Yersinia pseudotuberculosis PB1/+]|uniref:phage integrase n=1 Tax=Yersinia pseudotuberculosis TaxID=633 RepID=UPI00017397D5|nr:tyrosine-type recombinase/integrase [Yersinia pseudotuberculosis]AJJ65827.1 phage integrase family protein [Yersinia pseudotuberculosis PB1/+]
MSIKKLDDGQYVVDIRPAGRNGKRIRRTFSKKHEAVAFEKYVVVNYHEKEWLSKPTDKRSLSELSTLWWSYHGQNMDYGQKYKVQLAKVIRIMSDLCAFQIDKNVIARYRAIRLAGGVKASSVNRDLAVLSGMFTALINAGVYHSEHPLAGISKLKPKQTARAFLSQSEIKELLNCLDGDNRRVAILCLSTGARWGEAIKLRTEHIIDNRITFVATKNGKQRTVPISRDVFNDLTAMKSGLLFNDAAYLIFRQKLKSVKTDLPQGQATHVLRHTFATHFMINGGNIITLQRILGHSTIQQTMLYAHFSPDYLQDAVSFNPLKGKTSV